MKLFFGRFFSQQFKRTTLPPGPKVGTVSLSPRGDWRMPDEATADALIASIDALSDVRVLIVGSITRDTNIFDGIAQHTFGGTALYAARTYKQFGIDVRLVSRLAPADREPIAAQLPGVELIAQPSDVTTTFENSYGKDDERTQRVTAVAAPVDYRADYFDECDWLHLGPLHPLDLHERWLTDHRSKPAASGPAGVRAPHRRRTRDSGRRPPRR